MWTHIIVCIVGVVLGLRLKPETEFKRRELIGSVSGKDYRAEDFPDAGVLVVRAGDGTVASFERMRSGGWRFLRGAGHKSTIRSMAQDLGAEL